MNQRYSLTKYEKETIILYNQSTEPVNISGYDQKLLRKLSRLAKQHPDLCQRTDRGKYLGYYAFTVAKQCLSIRFNSPMSDEKKKAARERAKAARLGGNICT